MELDDKVATVIYAVIVVAWALAIFCLVFSVNEGVPFAGVLVAAFVVFLLTLPVWMLLFPLLAAPIAFVISAVMFRFCV